MSDSTVIPFPLIARLVPAEKPKQSLFTLMRSSSPKDSEDQSKAKARAAAMAKHGAWHIQWADEAARDVDPEFVVQICHATIKAFTSKA